MNFRQDYSNHEGLVPSVPGLNTPIFSFECNSGCFAICTAKLATLFLDTSVPSKSPSLVLISYIFSFLSVNQPGLMIV